MSNPGPKYPPYCNARQRRKLRRVERMWSRRRSGYIVHMAPEPNKGFASLMAECEQQCNPGIPAHILNERDPHPTASQHASRSRA